MYRFPNEYNEICVPAGAREEFLEKEVADLKEELSRKTEMLYAMEAELRKVSEGQMEWISIEDRLPKSEFVLCTDGKYVFADIIPDMEDVLEDGVTHWMPLPEPPKPKVPTFKDVFLKAFPKAVYPDVDCCTIFPKQFNPNACNFVCEECWNQPYFEEEEGEADA